MWNITTDPHKMYQVPNRRFCSLLPLLPPVEGRPNLTRIDSGLTLSIPRKSRLLKWCDQNLEISALNISATMFLPKPFPPLLCLGFVWNLGFGIWGFPTES